MPNPDETEMQELWITSTLDGTLQPSLYYHPASAGRVPLVVGLHTWSFDRFNQVQTYLPLCRQYGWALLLPEFRGPNLAANPHVLQACGSPLARRDVFDAIDFVGGDSAIDVENIFLLGCSGGGHMGLLLAADAPKRFKAVEVWCPVTDLIGWYEHTRRRNTGYFKHLEACFAGSPTEKAMEYLDRSPSQKIGGLLAASLTIHHGKHDLSVPCQHTAALVKELELHAPAALYSDFFDGGHEQFPAHSFEHFARLAAQQNHGVGITG